LRASIALGNSHNIKLLAAAATSLVVGAFSGKALALAA
jgi:hypothetical protein